MPKATTAQRFFVEPTIRPIFPRPPSTFTTTTQQIDQYSRATVSTDGSPSSNEMTYDYILTTDEKKTRMGGILESMLIQVGAQSALGTQTLNFMLNNVVIKTVSIDTTSTAVYNAKLSVDWTGPVRISISFTGNQICTMRTVVLTGVYVTK